MITYRVWVYGRNKYSGAHGESFNNEKEARGYFEDQKVNGAVELERCETIETFK